MNMVSRFTSIGIEGLFGDRNETIDFPDLDDPIRILYGVNGSGKTTILKIIQNTYRWNPLELIKLPFDSITFNKNTRGKFEGESYYFNRNNRNLYEIESMWMPKKSDEIYDYLIQEFDQINQIWGHNRSKWALQYNELSKIVERTPSQKLPSQFLVDNDRVRQNDLRVDLENLRVESENIRNDSDKLITILGVFLLKKLMELRELNNDNSLLTIQNWDDGVSLSWDPAPDREDQSNPSSRDMDIRIRRDFDYDTSLKIEKIENPAQFITSYDEDKVIEINCGSLLKITEAHKPRLDFQNEQIGKVLEILNQLNDISPFPGYKFSELFAGTDTTHIIRMPDLYDYWDLDWERIEQNLTGYEIERSVTAKNIHQSNLDKDFKITKPDIGKIKIHEFIRNHLPYEFITHAKVRKVKHFKIDKHYSKRNRPPLSVTDFFEYDKTAISFDVHGNPDSEYIHLPRVVDISTEREIGAEYFGRVKRYVNNENRVLLRSISDFKDRKLETYKKLNSSHIEMVQTRLKERGIEFDKFREQPIKSTKGRGQRYDATIAYHEIIKCISNAKKQSYSEVRHSVSNYLFSDLVPSSDLSRDNEYTVDSLDLKPLVTVIEELVSLSEIELFVDMIDSRFDEIKIDISSGVIKSGKDRISFSDLSSGERQKFLIFTNIGIQISNTSSSILMTIDEPEISLHLSWQRQFVDDVIEFIGELTSKYRVRYNEDDDLDQIVSLIISTHSPTLLANHFHRGQKLGEDDIDG
jgi:hypothetical protein